MRLRSSMKYRGCMDWRFWRENAACLWSFMGWKWLKKVMAFDIAGVVSTRPYSLQGYLNPKAVPLLGRDWMKGFSTAKIS